MPKCLAPMAFWTLLLLAPCAVEPVLTMGGTTGGQRFETSTFRYYGRPAHEHSIFDAQAVYLGASEICSPVESRVRGKIVFSDQSGAPCRLDDIYIALDKAGALSFVYLGLTNTPGFLCYLHHTWDPYKYSHRQMQMVLVGLL